MVNYVSSPGKGLLWKFSLQLGYVGFESTGSLPRGIIHLSVGQLGLGFGGQIQACEIKLGIINI